MTHDPRCTAVTGAADVLLEIPDACDCEFLHVLDVYVTNGYGGAPSWRPIDRAATARWSSVPMDCVWCLHPHVGPRTVRPVTAVCVHEHITTLELCSDHEAWVRHERVHPHCLKCKNAGFPAVPVTIVTPPILTTVEP